MSILAGLAAAAVEGAVSGLVNPVVKAWRSWFKTQADIAQGEAKVEAADDASSAKGAADAQRTADALARVDRDRLLDSLSGGPAPKADG